MNIGRLFSSLIPGAVLLLWAGTATGCSGFLFGGCEVRLIEVTGSGTWSFEGTTTEEKWFDRLADTNLPPGRFDPIADAFADASSRSGQLSWLISAFDTVPGWIGVRIPVPVRDGDRIPVIGSASVGGFEVDGGDTDGARVDIRLGEYRATAAGGEIVVLQASPLRVRLDLRTTAGDGKTLDLSGVMQFRVFVEERDCD